MRLVVQRVLESSVKVDGREVGRIGKGFMVLCGVEDGDTAEDVRYCVDKTVNLRIFEDENDKMNRSILDAGGEILAISQFTLHGDVRHGRRPSFIRAARPEVAVPMYDAYCQGLREAGFEQQRLHIVETMDEAVALIGTLLDPGDAVLFENDLPDQY